MTDYAALTQTEDFRALWRCNSPPRKVHGYGGGRRHDIALVCYR